MTTYARFLAVSFLCVAAFAAVMVLSSADPVVASVPAQVAADSLRSR